MYWPSLESERRPAAYGHVPVLMQEVLTLLACFKNQNYLDLTVGSGGHTEAILRATAPNGVVVGMDRDPEAIERASVRLKAFGARAKLVAGELGAVDKSIANSGLTRIDGALIDCGVSSFQLDDSSRGFSFTREGPLDMRMNPTTGKSAREWLAKVTADELADVIFNYGEDRYSRRIARAIIAARKHGTLRTTTDLANVVRSAVPVSHRPKTIDPATRTFQAIRIVVNEELTQLERGVAALLKLLPAGARIVVISFHSLEDRIIKNLFRDAEREGVGRALTKKPTRPTEEESAANPRARSARLRGFEIARGVA